MDIKRCNGKIYTIRSYETELIYVGSTAEKRLSARFSKHKSSYKYYLKVRYCWRRRWCLSNSPVAK